MKRVLTRSFDDNAAAQTAVNDLERAGFAENISLIGPQSDAASGASAAVGGVVGGAAGLLAGLAMVVVPGVGPVLAAGWLGAAGAAAGAVAGGLVGAMRDEGIEERDAHFHAETIRRGGTVVSLWVEEARYDEAASILDRAGAVDMSIRRSEYERAGWQAFDPNAGPYVPPPRRKAADRASL